MRRRGLVIAGAILAIIAIVVAWRCTARDRETASTHAPRDAARLPLDRRAQPHGSIAGTVRDDRDAPLAGARVCAASTKTDDRRCVASDPRGAYRLGDLAPATYTIHASARTFLPGSTDVTLSAGEHRSGADLVLARGGVEVTGTVTDISGGPIAHARVWSPTTTGDADGETDDAGRFSLWVPRGKLAIYASADGYAPAREDGSAPGTIDLQLTPESSIAGVVVDAKTGEPRGDVHVTAEPVEPRSFAHDHADVTDASGHFRITRLLPGRYALVATATDGFGRSDGSVLAALAQQVDGVVVKLHAAYQIAARIDAGDTPCPGAWFTIRRDASSDEVDGTSHRVGDLHVIDGVVPGRYVVRVRCPGHVHAASAPELVIEHADRTDLRWTVEPGATIAGHIRRRDGTPVTGAVVTSSARAPIAIDASGSRTATSDATGGYALTGLPRGSYRLRVTSTAGTAPPIDVELTGPTLAQDVVLDEGGTIRGVVVDARGAPMPRLEVTATRGSSLDPDPAYTDDTGAFTIAGVASGDYVVTAARRSTVLHRPGAPEGEPGERVHVTSPQAASVRLVVEAETLAIRGSVRDAAGAPIADAWITIARETGTAAASTYWDLDARPVLARTNGTFELGGLAAGFYTVRAFRKGGGDAIAEHVPAGGTTTLQLATAGSIAGTITLATGAPADDLSITVRSDAGFRRVERFYGTDGRYAVRDLPEGMFEVAVEAPTGRGAITTELVAGQQRTGVDLRLQALVTLTGTLVERASDRPVVGIRMRAEPVIGTAPARSLAADEPRATTDDGGHFAIDRVPAGATKLVGLPRDPRARWQFERTVRIPDDAPATYDLGKLPVVLPRVEPGAPVGKLGARFTHDDGRITVAWIDPKGAAAKTALRVGDVVTAVDRIGVVAPDDGLFEPLIAAPPGTTLELLLASGNAVQIVLAP
ncbi:MAG TPA: carboxypeptidase regulatory-like domain-containing protein [Kofleriaceae bacterium]|nr:carboxypeptidase regulatory-like domain-containing protein [Kofleriaceae bacterium]